MADAVKRGMPAIRVMMMPRDTNATGTIFGGVILSYIDQAGALEARRHTRHNVVTVAIDSVQFKQPVFVGDVLSFYASLVKIGATSITVDVHVDAEPFKHPDQSIEVTQARLVYVAVDDNRRSVSVGPAAV